MDLVKVCPLPCGTVNPASQFTCLKCQRSLVAVQPTLRNGPENAEEPSSSAKGASRLQLCQNPECAFSDNPPDETECVLCNEPLVGASPQSQKRDERNRSEPQAQRGARTEAVHPGGTRREIGFVVEFPFERVIVWERFAIGRDATFSPLAPKIQRLEKVSRRHAELLVVDGQLQVIDLGSMNHVYVNGIEIAKSVPIPLKLGDSLSFSSELTARVTE